METPVDKRTRNVDPDVASARAKLAVSVRTGDPPTIAEARSQLEEAKAARLRVDADVLFESAQKRRARVVITGSGKEPITPKQHAALYATQRAEAQAFIAAHPRSARGKWDEDTQDAWDALLTKHTRAHEALGCPRTAICRTRQG